MNRFFKLLLITTLIILFAGVMSDVVAQCPMCRIGAESNLKDGGTAAKGLNKGILYMFALPYLLVFTLGFLWWRNRRQASEVETFSQN